MELTKEQLYGILVSFIRDMSHRIYDGEPDDDMLKDDLKDCISSFVGGDSEAIANALLREAFAYMHE